MEGDGFSHRRTLVRIGNGYDLHRLVAGRPLILAGVTIPFELGLDGHSDADIVCHAVTDAILGAAGAGDIGRMFPDTDPQWKGANSIALLKGAVAKIARGRLPRVECRRDGDRAAAEAAAVSRCDARESRRGARQSMPSAVSVKGKTNEGVDSMGRGESMACHAVALLTLGVLRVVLRCLGTIRMRRP